ncbi:WD40 repeat-like protein [Choiromyces venosus 120613-1]|uniref:WD40 repeat-like protein n=1 Tax=Choiromyces venosus 120613-1 TaxID=1336337 RepID=A0A3N4JRV6_9PEZI|nr:WD40 repeat-like protein [Choiromyces venosus 120613-1]
MAYYTNNSRSTATSGTSSSTGILGDISADITVSSPPEDSISDLAFSMKSDLLAVASWDKRVRIYDVSQNGANSGKAIYAHEGPVLSVAWSSDGSKLVSGGTDNAARLWDITTGQSTQVAAHDEPIRSVRWFSPPGANAQLVATGSWDKTLKYWDLRQQQPVCSVNLVDRVYAMDVVRDLLVIGTAERQIHIINLTKPETIFETRESPLKWQTRVVTCFPDATGFALGGIEGRCAFLNLDKKDTTSPFSFKCHRAARTGAPGANVYGVNAISFHPVHGTFSTAGADGTFHFWDKIAKHKTKGFPSVGGIISATGFNRNGSIFAYAVSYDWSKGHQFNTPTYPNKIMLHRVQEGEANRKTKY